SEEMLVEVEGKPKFRGVAGVVNGKRAVRITSAVIEEE
ncbi:MAG: FliM/FliN family flagellar motor switch protein, partial [Magnetococcales bacterium]|nr:FliM/FliN family flagellar motor switch protein [Magnetococcales bacterium]